MNTVNIIGRLTRDPELRFTQGGTAVTTVRVAIPRRKSKDKPEPGAVYIDVTCWAGLAETVAEHLAKGRQVAVTGRLEHRQWEGQDGSKHERNEIIAEDVTFLGSPASPGAGTTVPVKDQGEPA